MFERVTDMPQVLRAGLTPDVQNVVRGIVNYLVYDENHDAGLAVQKAQKALENAGYKFNGTRWEPIIAKVKADGLITKLDDDKRLVFGWASVVKTEDGKVLVDRQKDFIDDEWEMERSAYHYVLHSRDGGIMHVAKGVSTMVESMAFTTEKIEAMGLPVGLMPVGWWLGFQVHDGDVWKGVKEGLWAGFSVHGRGARKAMPLTDFHTNEGV